MTLTKVKKIKPVLTVPGVAGLTVDEQILGEYN
jgi:hypothetical protein